MKKALTRHRPGSRDRQALAGSAGSGPAGQAPAPARRLLRRLGPLRRRLGPLLRGSPPLAKLGKLRGKPLIAVLVALAVVVVVAVLSLKPGPDDDKQVREALDTYAKATRDKDYQTLCDSLYATDLVERIRSAGLPCEVALRTGLQNRQNPQLEVQAVEVNGEQALARARASASGEVPAVVTIRLVREGRWRAPRSASRVGESSRLDGGRAAATYTAASTKPSWRKTAHYEVRARRLAKSVMRESAEHDRRSISD